MNRRRLTHRPRPPRGFTLVELMVALALGLLLLGALITLVVSTITNRSELDKSARQIENGRYALQVLSADIAEAGFLGTTGTRTWNRVAPPNACAASMADLGYTTGATPTLPLSVQMLPNDNTSCMASLSGANVKPNTGMLLVTRVSSQALTPTDASATGNAAETYVQVSSCKDETNATPPKYLAVALGSATASFTLTRKDCVTPAPLRRAIQRIYFISTCNQCGKDTVPTLKVAEYVGGAMSITPLVDGIEDMQFDYGIDMDGNGSPDCYVSNTDAPAAAQIAPTVCPQPATAYDWTYDTPAKVDLHRADVMAMRVSVLARATEATGGWKDSRTYNLGLVKPAVGPFNDNYKRHVYSTVTRIINPSGLRELP